jgi:hypothetical protein
MKKQLLLFGAGVAVATGSVLLMLALLVSLPEQTLASEKFATYSVTEAGNDGDECRTKNGTDCGSNDCPTDKPNCHILKSSVCDCRS